MAVKTVLHVDDDPEWLEHVRATLRGIKGLKLTSCNSLRDAQGLDAQHHFDLCVCDGRIEQRGDGWAWARRLHQEGRFVCVLAANRESYEKFPFFDKGEFTDSEREKLVDFVQKSLGL